MHLFPVFLASLLGAQLQLRDLLADAPDVAQILGNGCFGLRMRLLEIEQAISRHITFFGQIAHAAQLLLHELEPLSLADERFLQPLVLEGQPDNILLHALEFAADRRLARSQQLLLQCKIPDDARIAPGALQGGRKGNHSLFVALGYPARFGGAGNQVLATAHFRVGCRLDVVHAHQRIPGLDYIAFLDQDGLDRATGQVLDRFLLGRDNHRPRQRNALVEWRRRGPEEKPPHAGDHDPPAEPGHRVGIGLDSRYGGAILRGCLGLVRYTVHANSCGIINFGVTRR